MIVGQSDEPRITSGFATSAEQVSFLDYVLAISFTRGIDVAIVMAPLTVFILILASPRVSSAAKLETAMTCQDCCESQT